MGRQRFSRTPHTSTHSLARSQPSNVPFPLAPQMSQTTGADLPPEVLSFVLASVVPSHINYHNSSERRRSKHELVAPSLVCRYWSEVIRPFLFQILILRSHEDVRLLKNVVSSPRYTSSSLFEAIQIIEIHQKAADTKPWLHHIHGLSTRLRGTIFTCTVLGDANDPASTVGRWAPFKSLPSLTPSYVRLSVLTLDRLIFASTTELARVIDSFSTLKKCDCYALTLLDPSPVTHSRRIRRRLSSSLQSCRMSRCKEMTVLTQATLASDVLVAAARLGLDEQTWSGVVHAVLALAPSTFRGVLVRLHGQRGSMFDGAIIYCSSPVQDGPMSDYVKAYVQVRRLNASPGVPLPPAYIESIALALSSTGVHDVESFPWDVLQPAIDLPLVRHLRFEGLDGQEYEAMKKILCSVLRRSQLTWALDSGKLQFITFDSNPVTSADVLSVPTEHTVDGIAITLNTAEQAEWLLHPVSHPLLATRKEYLRKVVAERASMLASADTSSGTAPSTAGGVRDAAVGQVQVPVVTTADRQVGNAENSSKEDEER
ncbi:uncharacterized protein PHACADRAFT_261062 [Phanerochaete carnosa HHB-10118-sp]|uniref:F-box domain-containing protein n=1 Tax=Phanerochaete carnosa (strain HHB-10118-sp) TaxID=650164 RepID=K5W0Z6_PHACS|nr:uncharacterized protein PHACADRAFT_261062 [Phanerochaete carnosa HHB-10118-sp]EKM52559.1 hypothetical protein PHACADRAFT_261062 [Phanerochaete carnosa HHB-10118-sp]